jgi:hypothetical protein
MTLGRIFIRTEMEDGVEFPGRIIGMDGVDTPGRHIVEVVRSGGPRDGERRGWAVLDLGEEGEGDGWEQGGYSFTIFKTLEEAQAAKSETL